MTLQEIKQISIREYLHTMGIYPVNNRDYYGMYHCPYRNDQHASFKVDYRQNIWHDFGTGDGGSIIDLVMKINRCLLNEALTELNQYISTTGRQMQDVFDKANVNIPTITIQSIIPITHPKLTAWVQQRSINLELANRYCREVRYNNRDKTYFAIGFRNDKGGYELNSPPDFKGCIPPKEITTFRNGKASCLVFEGFWDFLSYLTIQKIENPNHDVAVLNSTANVQKAMDFLKSYREIYTYLDNNDSGRKATELIKNNCLFVNDRSERYAVFKDLNDYLRNKPAPKQEVKNRKTRLRR